MPDLGEIDARTIRALERKLKRHSNQIGRLCVLWSNLEMEITLLLVALSSIGDSTAKNVLMGSLDLRAKLHATLAIAFKKKRTDEWFDDLQALLNRIDNALRPERNRMIHDFWMTIPEKSGRKTVTRMQLRANLRKEPPAGTPTLSLAEWKPIKPADIAALCESIVSATLDIIRLRRAFEWLPLSNRLRVPTLPPSPAADQNASRPKSPRKPSRR